MIDIFQSCLSTQELARIDEVFRSDWIGTGNATLEFESFEPTLIKRRTVSNPTNL